MKISRKSVRRVGKIVNVFVTLAMVLQPVGTPSILGALALADETASGAADVAPAEQSTAPGSESPASSDADASKTAESAAKDSTSSSVEPAITDPVKTIVESASPATVENPAVPTPANVPAEISPNVTNPENATPVQETSSATGTIAPETAPAEAPAAEASGKVCLAEGANITSSSKGDWNIGDNSAETKGKVELGVKYVFPLDEKVSVTFTCLPVSDDDRTTLKIEQIKTSDINLPEGIVPASEYAYDITTGMKDGDFEYDLTLPKAIFDDSKLVYIEKSASEITNSDLSKSDLESISDSKIEEGKNALKIDNLDHLTVFMPTISLSVLNSLISSGCNEDSAGANDEPGQKDLTKMCADYTNIPSSVDVLWNWDDTGWSGNNSGDACSLFDTDGDGLVNYSLCVIVKNDPAQYDSKALYSCGDDANNRCTNPISTLSPSTGTVCDASVKNEDPFSVGNDFPDDTVANCTIDLDDVGGSIAELIDVCSYPSQQPNSDPSDCVIFKTSSGKLQVDKVLIPSNDNGLFNLKIDGATISSDVGNNGSTGVQVVDVGNHTVGETAGTGTNLTSYNSSIICKDLHGSGSIVAQSSDSGPLSVDVQDGDDIVCTITNSLNQATLTVNKVVVNDNGGTATIANFQAKLDGNNIPWATPQSLLPGSYTVSEDAFAGYSGTIGGDCDAGGNVTLAAGENKICTITNDDQPATLIVKKIVVNDNGGSLEADDFTFQVDSGAAQSFEADGQNDLSISAGIHNVIEPAVSGYTTTYNNCSNINIPNGGTATCTITNDDQPATLIVKKIVVNDNGGSLEADDFTFQVNGGSATSFESDGQNNLTVNAGTYNITEPAVTGYTTSYDNCADVVVPNGGSATCIITNDDIAPTLTLVKTVINDNGGTKVAADFPLFIDGVSATSGIAVPVAANALHTASETPVAGYTPSLWGGSCATNGTITLQPGDNLTCTITNDDQAGTLIVIKHVVNDDGGSAVAGNFTMNVSGTNVSDTSFAGVESPGTTVTLNAGSYSVDENAFAGYSKSLGTDCSGTIANGQTKTCTITNNDQPGTLTVIKHVINDNGGTLAADDFTMNVTGTNVSDSSFPGVEDPGTTVTLNAGGYSVDEDAVFGYAKSFSGDCTGTIANGESKTCTITNNDIQPQLIVIKHVVTDNNGGAVASNFTMNVSGSNPTPASFPGAESPGTNVAINAGAYSVSETGPSGYTDTYSPECDSTISVGETKTCTITNDDQPAHIIVIKHVITDDGGTLLAGNFTMHITGTAGTATFAGVESPGVNTQVNAGTFNVSEDAVSGYSSSTSGDCSGSIANGETKTCTITNNDQAATLIVKKVLIKDNGGTETADDFAFSVNGGGNVNFEADGQNDFTVNAGTYSVVEQAYSGYSTTYDNCTNIVIPNGGSATCTITNNDIQPTLTVIKHVINDNDGTALASDFTMSVAGSSPSPASFPGMESPGTLVAINAGSYDVTETGPAGYAASFSSDCTGSIAIGENKTCTVTNNDIQPQLIVVKHVVNDNGGNAVASNFAMHVSGNTPSPSNFAGAESPGTNVAINAGAYSVSETGLPGYADSYSNDCTGSITVGETKTCTITNDDEFGKIIIEKQTNPSGDSQKFDFTGDVSGQVVDDGQIYSIVVPGTYSSTETVPTGWDLTNITCDDGDSSGDLAGKTATFNVQPSETVKCTFTNTRRGSIDIIKSAIGPDGSSTDFGFDTSWATPSSFTLKGGYHRQYFNLQPGAYSVTESSTPGWDLTDLICASDQAGFTNTGTSPTASFTLRPGENIACTFTNTERGSISGMKFNDIGGDGAKDAGDSGLSGWKIFIDENDNQSLDAGEISATTLADGTYQFPDIIPNTYSVCEVEQNDWQRTYPASKNCQDAIVNPGVATNNVDFGNFELGEITACKYNDLNGNGIYESPDDQPLPGISMKLSKDISANWVLQDTKETGANGCTTFSGLTAGQYRVEEDYSDPDLAGFYSSDGNTHHDVNVVSGTVENRIFLNTEYRTISGTKFNDLNGNGARDAGEPGLENWTIFIDYNNSGFLDPGEPSTITDANGNYQFANLAADFYAIAETLEPGWTQTFPVAGHYDIDLHYAVTSTGNDFGNVQLTDIHGYKWDDLNGNGIQDGAETKLSGWEIFIDKNDNSTWDAGEPKTATSSDPDPQHFGWYWFEDLLPGQYKVCEVQQAGWTQTYPAPQCHTINLPDDCAEFSEGGLVAIVATPNFVQTFCEFDFGNQFVPPSLQIQKSNNKFPNDQVPGSDVEYTLTVTALDNDVNGVVVTDLPPDGFTYRPGSGTASSSLGGAHIGALGLAHAYASPGVWDLGNMKKDEIITLAYVADISNNQESGSYPDLAWTEGTSLIGSDVLGTGVNSHFVQDAFVGTEVSVVRLAQLEPADVNIETDRDTRHKDTKTIRKTVILPATGASPGWIALAIILLLAGAGIILLGKRKKDEGSANDVEPPKNIDDILKFLIAALIGLSLFFGAKTTHAATTLAAQMMRPDSPYQTTDFDLGFVALDINGDPVTVKCFLGSSATPFQTVNLAGGGTSGNCDVNSGVIPGDGTYQFHITASDGSETITTSDVSLEVITGGPGTPVAYKHDRPSGCTNVITLTTADDGGKTVRVELYKSLERSYTADAGTLVTNITGLASNQPVSYTDIISGACDRFYYSARSFDALGNGSGIVADERTTVRTEGGGTRTVTTTVTGTGGTTTTGGGAVSGVTTGEEESGAVAGEETVPAGEEQPGEVLGEEAEAGQAGQNFFSKNKGLTALGILIILGILYYGYKKITDWKKRKLPIETPEKTETPETPETTGTSETPDNPDKTDSSQ